MFQLSADRQNQDTRLVLSFSDSSSCFCNAISLFFDSNNCEEGSRYTVRFDSNRLTEDCTRIGCQLQSQLHGLIDRIKDYGQYGNCKVNEQETKEKMTQTIHNRKYFLYCNKNFCK